jgi:hypothetical protein
VKDTHLYQHLLGLNAPWTVSSVELDTGGKRVTVRVEHGKKATFWKPTSLASRPFWALVGTRPTTSWLSRFAVGWLDATFKSRE